jgi:hypothetical protein
VRDPWPQRPDPRIVVSPRMLSEGAMVTVRTRWGGLRRLHLRLVGAARGRPFVIGHSRHWVCHRAWMSEIVHVDYGKRKGDTEWTWT